MLHLENSRYEPVLHNLPGNEVLDFAGSTFSENDVDIDNKAEHSVDTAKANFETASE